MDRQRRRPNRRQFLSSSAASLAAFTIAPSHILGGEKTPPSERLNLAYIGAGGRGVANSRALSPYTNVLALCDVDDQRAKIAYEKYPSAQRFRDYRKMLDRLENSIDAVVVSTPDHTHAVAVMDALRRGKHVYCEKPLAHSIHEIRAMMELASQKGVVTQLGNQGHASRDIRKLVEWVRDGAIGRVHTIHAACSAVHCKIDQLPQRREKPAVLKGVDWDLWLGPAAKRAFHPMYIRGQWRGWKPFGNGTIGDWVCHVLDPSFWALELGAPASVKALDVGDYDPSEHADTFPCGSALRFEFPARGDRPPVTLFWYSGSRSLPRPAELEPDREPVRTGAVLFGDGGTIMHGSHGARDVELLPKERMLDYKRPTPTIPRVKNHRHDFVQAILEGRRAGSDFVTYGGPLTEIALLGVIALSFPGRKLSWNAAQGRFTDCDEANALIAPPYRRGWVL